MKITIERSVNAVKDECYFRVKVDNKQVGSFEFKIGALETDIYNERKNYQSALAMAERIEVTGGIKDVKEIVYEKEVGLTAAEADLLVQEKLS